MAPAIQHLRGSGGAARAIPPRCPEHRNPRLTPEGGSEIRNHPRRVRGSSPAVANLEPNDDDGALQIMYGVDGRRFLIESTRNDLSGYAGARPVRIDNGAFSHLALVERRRG